MSRSIDRIRRARSRAEYEREVIARLRAKERVREAARTRLRAKFVVETAIEHGVEIKLVKSPLGADVRVTAPTAPNLQKYADCTVSFRNAVIRSLAEYVRLGRRGGDGP
jgi:hypothetical protein